MNGEAELVAIHDAGGAVIGSDTRQRMRAEGRWHGVASVLVRSTEGDQVFVHRRTEDKDVYAGLHDCWAGGVVAAGESPEAAARRELAEELGIRGVAPTPLFTSRFEGGSVRCHAHLYEVRWDGPTTLQPEEVAAGWWMPLGELRERLLDDDWPFVPDGRQFALEWFRYGAP